MILGWMPPGSTTITKGYNMAQTITEEQKQLLQQTMLDNGMNAWEYMLTRPKDSQPWIIAGILSCMKKGYGMTLLEISWEARDLRYATNQNV